MSFYKNLLERVVDIFRIYNEAKDHYLYYDDYHRLCETNLSFKAAVFPTEGKAHNTLVCSFPKRKRDGWKVVGCEDGQDEEQQSYEIIDEISKCEDLQPIRYDIDYQSMGLEPQNWKCIVNGLSGMYSKMLDYRNQLKSQFEEVNAGITDCMHACECKKLNAVKGYKMYDRIRSLRIKRRFIKNEMRKLNIILESTNEDLANKVTYEKLLSVDNQVYIPRLSGELFEECDVIGNS